MMLDRAPKSICLKESFFSSYFDEDAALAADAAFYLRVHSAQACASRDLCAWNVQAHRIRVKSGTEI